jgi:hypothetical protein
MLHGRVVLLHEGAVLREHLADDLDVAFGQTERCIDLARHARDHLAERGKLGNLDRLRMGSLEAVEFLLEPPRRQSWPESVCRRWLFSAIHSCRMAASATRSSKSNVQSIGNFLVDASAVWRYAPPACRTKITHPVGVVSPAVHERQTACHAPAALRPAVRFSCMLIGLASRSFIHDRSHLARYHAQGQGGRLPGLSA